jgi:beta-glucosidase
MEGRTYRYFKGKVLYPFGYGLSYTKFDYSNLKLSKNNINTKDSVIVSVNVKNSGNYDGDEVVQLYVKSLVLSPQTTDHRPLKALKGFKRISLKKGESKTVQFTLKAEALKYYDEQKNDFVIEPGTYEIQIGASSDDIRLHDNLIVK